MANEGEIVLRHYRRGDAQPDIVYPSVSDEVLEQLKHFFNTHKTILLEKYPAESIVVYQYEGQIWYDHDVEQDTVCSRTPSGRMFLHEPCGLGSEILCYSEDEDKEGVCVDQTTGLMTKSEPVSLEAYSFTPATDLKQYHFSPEVCDFWSKHVEGKLNVGVDLKFDLLKDRGLFGSNVDQEGINRFSNEVFQLAGILGYYANSFIVSGKEVVWHNLSIYML